MVTIIIITIDGLSWKIAKDEFKDIFPEQSMRMIRNNVRIFSDTKEKGSPTVIGLAVMFSGEKIKNLHKDILMPPTWNIEGATDSKPIKFLDRGGNKLDLIFDHFDKSYLFVGNHGPSPYHDFKNIFNDFSEIDKVGECPSEEIGVFFKLFTENYDLFWIHTSIIKTACLTPGPYEQGRIPSVIPYDQIRKDKVWKKKVYMFGIMRYKYIINLIQKAFPDEIIVISSDHGTMTDYPFTPGQIDEIPIIVNRNVDLSDVNFQWDFKKLILRLKNE